MKNKKVIVTGELGFVTIEKIGMEAGILYEDKRGG